MIFTRSFTYSLLFSLVLLAHLAYAEQKPIALVGGWEYCRGDSPLTTSGKLEWLYKPDSDQSLLPINKPSEIPIIPGRRELWLRLQLENYKETNIEISSLCSYEEKYLQSYRRDGKNSGRALDVIAMKGK